MREPGEAAVPQAGKPPPAMFGGEGQRLLDSEGARLFPVTVRPAFMRLLWVAVGMLACAATVVGMALAGTLR